MIRRPPSSPLFPYTPLFRSSWVVALGSVPLRTVLEITPVGGRMPTSRHFSLRRVAGRPPRYVSTRGLRESGVKLRSEEHTSELSHANISYAVFCLKKKQK